LQGDENIPDKFWLIMVFLALLVSFSFQGSRGLYETSEGRYAESAREMVERGNWLEPTLGYRPHWTKPPLAYWAIAGGIELLGSNEWGVRLYNAGAFFLAVLVVAYLGVTLWGKTTGLLAGLIYASSLFPVLGAYAVTTDMLLTLWEVSAVACYIKAYRGLPSVKGTTWIVAMWLLFGLGFLTKGPPVLIPLIPILVWHFQQEHKLRIANPWGIFLFLLTGFSWYVAVCLRHPGLLSYFLGQEVVARMTSSSVHNHQWYKPFVIYLPALTLGAGPWLYFGLKLLWQKRLARPSVLWSCLRKGTHSSFLLLWLILPLILFFLVKSRLELYVLPLYAPVALAIARHIYKSGGGLTIVRRVAVLAVCTGFVLVGVKGLAAYYPSAKNMKALYGLCRRAGGDNAAFVVFDESKLYGLQFYLNGRLQRVSLTGKEAWADGTLQDAISKVRGLVSSGPPYVFISYRKGAPALYDILRESGIRFKGFDNEYWIACLVERGERLSDESL